MAPATPGSLQESSLRARAVRGHLTRFRTSCGKACDNLIANPSAWARADVESVWNKVKGEYDVLMEVYQQCILLDEDTDAAASVWEAKSLEVSADVDVMRGKVQTAFAAMDRALKAQAVQPSPPVPTSV